MPLESIPIGVLTAMTQNVIFALPVVQVRLFCSDAAPAFQQSNSPTFANNVAVTLTDGMANLAGGFIRATGGNVTVMLRRA